MTHRLLISQDDEAGTNLDNWFENINAYDILTLRSQNDPADKVLFCLVLPIHGLNPANGGYQEPGTLDNSIPYEHVIVPGLPVPQGYYQLHLHCYQNTGATTLVNPFPGGEPVYIGYSLNPIIKHDANSYTWTLITSNIANLHRGEFYFTEGEPLPSGGQAPAVPVDDSSLINYIVVPIEAHTQHDTTGWINRIKAGEIITVRELDYKGGLVMVTANFIYNGIRDIVAHPSTTGGQVVILPVKYIDTSPVTFPRHKFYQISISGTPHETWNYRFIQQGNTPIEGTCSPVNANNPGNPVVTFGDLTSIIFNNVDLDNLDCQGFFDVFINQQAPGIEYDLIMRKMHHSDYVIFNVSITNSLPPGSNSLVQVSTVYGNNFNIDYDAVYTCNLTKKGLDGAQGPQGPQGVQGVPGADAQNKNTEITFSRTLPMSFQGDQWTLYGPPLGPGSSPQPTATPPSFRWLGSKFILNQAIQVGHPIVHTMYAIWYKYFDPNNPGNADYVVNNLPYDPSGMTSAGSSISGIQALAFGSVDNDSAQTISVSPAYAPSQSYNTIIGHTNYMEPVAPWQPQNHMTPYHVCHEDGVIIGYSINGIKNTWRNVQDGSLAHVPVFCGVGRHRDLSINGWTNWTYDLSGSLSTKGSAIPLSQTSDLTHIKESGTEYFVLPYGSYNGEPHDYKSHQIEFNKGDIIVAGCGPGFPYIGPNGVVPSANSGTWKFQFINGFFSISVFVKFKETDHRWE